MLKEPLEALIQENTILKRAVSVQHERQIEYEDQSQELKHLKQLVSQYQEQLRTLEVGLMNSTFDAHRNTCTDCACAYIIYVTTSILFFYCYMIKCTAFNFPEPDENWLIIRFPNR